MTGINLIRPILDACRDHPERMALRIPQMEGQRCAGEQVMTYGDLGVEVGRLQRALQAMGLKQGDRVLILSRVRSEIYTLMIALLGLGMVPVLIDRGMSPDRIRQSIRLSKARAAIGEARILRLWWLFPPLWFIKRLAIDDRLIGVDDLRTWKPDHADPQAVDLDEHAHGLITFTSGSTGQPKGADRTHASLIAQHDAIREHWRDIPDDIDSPCFPVMVLHNLCCGITTVLPRVDLAAPGQVDAAQVLGQIGQDGITRVSGAPAYMRRLVNHAIEQKLELPHVRAVAIGGSTLFADLIEKLPAVFPHADFSLVYGSTEAEPVAVIGLSELRADGDLHPGHLVGLPVPDVQIAVVSPDAMVCDEITVLAARLPFFQVGEILVAGPHVLKGYVDNPEATRENKIPRHDGEVWHRTGDAGFLDERGRLWLVGRMKDVLQLGEVRLWPYPLEKALDALPGVRRSAAILWQKQLLLVIEGDLLPSEDAVRRLLIDHQVTAAQWALIPLMPVDGRHNSKIDRPALRNLLQADRLKPQALTIAANGI